MLDDEDLNDQLELLKSYKHVLSILLRKQTKQGGEAHASVDVLVGIEETRENIRRAKEYLRKNGVEVEDGPNDTPHTSEPERSRLRILHAVASFEVANPGHRASPREIATTVDLEDLLIADYLEVMEQEGYVRLSRWTGAGRTGLAARVTPKGRLYLRAQAAADT